MSGVPESKTPSLAWAPEDGTMPLPTLIRLAEFAARPSRFLHPSRCQVGPFDAAALQAMQASRPFRRATERSLAETWLSREVPSSVWSAVGTAPHHATLAKLLTAPIGEVERVARFLGAAVVSPVIAKLLQLADRRRVREVMGEEIFQFAREEAPLMFPAVPGLLAGGERSGVVLTGADGADRFAGLAREAVMTLVERLAPGAARLLALRFAEEQVAGLGPLADRADPVAVSQALRVLKRKEPRWSASIA